MGVWPGRLAALAQRATWLFRADELLCRNVRWHSGHGGSVVVECKRFEGAAAPPSGPACSAAVGC